MNYATIKYYDIANGPGVRTSIFVSGCRHHCPGCFNEVAWDFGYGQPFDKAVRNEIFASCQPDYIAGISLLGGEPFEPENQRELLPFVRNFRALYPNKSVWCYSGYTWEQLTGSVPCASGAVPTSGFWMYPRALPQRPPSGGRTNRCLLPIACKSRMPMSYKTTNDLMQHLRDNGIAISGETQKQQLVTTGYYHGYKGYRFFKSAGARLPFSSYQELYATIQYDSALKALFYGKMMFIETAVKNIALQGILENVQSESISDVLDRVVCSYNNSPANFTVEQKKRAQQNKLNLQRSIQSSLANAYAKGNPKITHFYNNPTYSGVPLWAFFEIMTMGDFGYLLSCLTFPVRKDISTRIGLDLSNDTSCELLFRYIYALKDLRNAIAHNAVVFDTRFRNFDPTKAMKACLRSAIQLPYVNFKTIGDYVILMSYYLKLLQMPNSEILKFIEEFEHITETYRSEVNPAVASIVIHPDLTKRMEILKNYI